LPFIFEADAGVTSDEKATPAIASDMMTAIALMAESPGSVRQRRQHAAVPGFAQRCFSKPHCSKSARAPGVLTAGRRVTNSIRCFGARHHCRTCTARTATVLEARGRDKGEKRQEAPMRIPALAILAIAAVLTATPALAQTYDPNYPVCLQTYGRAGGYIQCAYISLAQCNATASGRAAQCITNPYFAGAQVLAGPRHRQRRGVY
jgi:hypothetical protein